MPKLRRLSGKQVVAVLESFGFEVARIRGSHHHLKRAVEGVGQNINVPVHGTKPLPIGTLRSIYRHAKVYIPEDDLKPHFYADT